MVCNFIIILMNFKWEEGVGQFFLIRWKNIFKKLYNDKPSTEEFL